MSCTVTIFEVHVLRLNLEKNGKLYTYFYKHITPQKHTHLPRIISGTTPVCMQAVPLASAMAAASLLSDTPNSIFSFLEDFGRFVSRKV